MKFGIRVICKKLLIEYECRQNRDSDSHDPPNSANESLHVISQFLK